MSEDDYGGKTVYHNYEYAVIVNEDGTFSENPIVEISDLEESYQKVQLLKMQNNWKYPVGK